MLKEELKKKIGLDNIITEDKLNSLLSNEKITYE